MPAIRTKYPPGKKRKGRRKVRQRTQPQTWPSIFLPDHLKATLQAINLRGLSNDDELAAHFGITDAKLVKQWKEQYSSFKEAVEGGYTEADQEILEALFKRARGYSHPEEKIFMWDGEIYSKMTTKHYPPSDAALKLWMTNRQRENWKDRNHTSVSGGSGDASPIGLREETKQEVMSSILALITPKPDNPVTIDAKTGKIIEEDDPVHD